MSACIVVTCENKALSKGFCGGHYSRLRNWGHTRPEIPLRNKSGMGREAERAVAVLLQKAHGRRVVRQGYYAPFDILVDGVHRVEVKVSDSRKTKRGPEWFFNIHRHGKLVENCDFYIFRLQKVPFSKAAIHLLLRAPIARLTVSFSFRSLLSEGSQYVQDFYRFARGEFPPSVSEAA